MQRERGLYESCPPENDDKGYDYNLLKEYMGDSYRNWVRLSDAEKSTEWEKAQSWYVGKKYGKHRAMDRQRTPPGYWNNEFEGTQEEREQRDEAKRIERIEVEERWREAMRPEGRWKFADE